MIHLEFAIDPEQIKDFRDLQLLESRFGFDKGALLSCFPKEWYRTVAEKLNRTTTDNQIDRVTDRLSSLKSRSLFSSGREYQGGTWLGAANQSHAERPFHRIVEDTLNQPPELVSKFDLLEEDDFSVPAQILRTADALANASKALLIGAEKVTIIDPFFCLTKSGYRKTLLAMMALCIKKSVTFHIFSEEDGKPAWVVRNAQLDSFKNEMPGNIKLIFYCISDNDNGYIHPRAIFTGKGGIIYDRGFSEPGDRDQRGTPTDINLMSNAMHQQKSSDYNEVSQSAFFALVRPVWKSHI